MSSKKEPESVDDITQKLEKALTQRYKLSSGVKREGNEIVVPPFMNLRDAAEAIASYEKQSEEYEETSFVLEDHPHNCAHAFYRAMTQVYGNLVAQGSWFSHGKTMLIPLGLKESIKVPIGPVTVPGLPIGMHVEIKSPSIWEAGEWGAVISFRARRKFQPLLQEIEAVTRQHLEKDSIFKGKAIDTNYAFIDLTSFNRERVIYSSKQALQLEANVFALVKYTGMAIKANVSLKRGILLHGDYGTGKTLTALYTASLCAENGWTFILVRHNDSIEAAINMAQRMQPACVFYEDIDAAAGEERTADVNGILNTIDGVLSKDSKVLTILTTNHVEKVNPAMLRPGRLDAVIKLGELDQESVLKFITDCATDSEGTLMLDEELDPAAIFEAAKGYVPAFLKEAVSKATLYAIARGDYDGYSAHLTTQDIVAALNELRPQYELMMAPKNQVKEISFESVMAWVAHEVIRVNGNKR